MEPASESGYLAVTIQPGSQVDRDSFCKLCIEGDNLTGLGLPAGVTGDVYTANDGVKPVWNIAYDVFNLKSLKESMAARSESSRGNPEKIESLERKVYKKVSTRGDFSGPGPIQVAVTMVVKMEDLEDFNRWYEEEHIDMLSKIPGWLRTRRFFLVLADVQTNMPNDGHVEYLAVHDYTADNGQGGKEHQAARDTPWRTRVLSKLACKHTREWRHFQSFNAHDGKSDRVLP